MDRKTQPPLWNLRFSWPVVLITQPSLFIRVNAFEEVVCEKGDNCLHHCIVLKLKNVKVLYEQTGEFLSE